MTSGRGWWDDAFGAAYLTVYAHRDDASARPEADFALRATGAGPGDLVLDAGCGAGRHARALATAGVRVVAMDRSLSLLREAARRAGGPSYVAGDLRHLPFRSGVFAHAVSLFTSFGYFDEAGDRAQLREIRRVLRPGGSLLLDFLNAPRVIASLVPESERAAGAWSIRERRRVRDGRVEKRVDVTDCGRVVATWTESVRLWTRDEVRALLAECGFSAESEFGDLAGAPWSASAERLVTCARAS